MRRLLVLAAALLWASPAFATALPNIANAPAWQASHAYVLKDRIVAGAAWDGAAYTNGAALCLFAVTVAGTTSTDPTVYNTACASGTPAGVGGGLDGTIPAGWSGAATVTDGDAHFALLTRVDYVTLTGWAGDTATNWATSTSFNYYAINNGGVYGPDSGSDTRPCTSASSGGGPTPVPWNTLFTDGGCHWRYLGELTYTSEANRWPHQLPNVPTNGHVTMQFADFPVHTVWYGGQQRPQYQPAQNGEFHVIALQDHEDFTGEYTVHCQGSGAPMADCVSDGVPYNWTFTVAPGDSFEDNVTPGDGPLRVDNTKGVTFFTDSLIPVTLNENSPIFFGDSYGIIERGQFQNTIGPGLQMVWFSATPGGTPAGNNNNGLWVRRNIIDGGGVSGTVGCDVFCRFQSNLIISRQTTAGCFALHSKYQIMVDGNTFINASGACVAIIDFYNALTSNTMPPWNNNLFLNFLHDYAYNNVTPQIGANNATSGPATDSGALTDRLTGIGLTVKEIPGLVASGITVSNQLVNSTVGASFDGRLKNTGANAYGTAAAFSFSQSGPSSQAWMGTMVPGADIFGTTRPVSGRYDIGAAMFIPGGACVISGASLSGTHTFPGGSPSGTVVGTMSSSTSGTCDADAWSITSTGSDHSSTACNASSGTDFQAAGASLELNTTLTTGTYANICYTNTISGATGSPFTQAVTITGTGPPGPVKGGKARGGLWH